MSDVEFASRDLVKLVGRCPGFELVRHGNTAAVRSALGEKFPLRGAHRLPHSQLKNLEKWMRPRADAARAAARQRAHYADDGERAGTAGPGMASSARRNSQKRLRQVLDSWAKMLPDDQARAVTQMLVVLSETDQRFARARREVGV